MCVSQQLPDPDSRALRPALETFGRPGFERNPGETLVHFLRRHISATHGRIMNDHATPAHSDKHDEMVVVPVQDTG